MRVYKCIYDIMLNDENTEDVIPSKLHIQ